MRVLKAIHHSWSAWRGLVPVLPLIVSVSVPAATSFASPVADSFAYPASTDVHVRDPLGRANIGYAVLNSGLADVKSNCYGVNLSKAYHAGEDWFGTTSMTVSAVAAGTVAYSSKLNSGTTKPEQSGATTTYPGGVVIIEHTLPDASHVWSMYAHLDPAKILVSQNATVSMGQTIATGLIQQSAGKSDNTDLHWEMRYFFDGSGINSAQTYKNTCSGIPGPGYTYPGQPDNFVANGGAGPNYHWTNPSAFVANHATTTSTTTLGGTVRLASTGTSISGAMITLYRLSDLNGTLVRTTTDSNGHYTLSDVSASDYELSVQQERRTVSQYGFRNTAFFYLPLSSPTQTQDAYLAGLAWSGTSPCTRSSCTIKVTGQGWLTNTPVTVSMGSGDSANPVPTIQLGTVNADGGGSFSTQVKFAHPPAGTYAVSAGTPNTVTTRELRSVTADSGYVVR